MEKEFKDIYYKIYNENDIAHIEALYRKRGLNILKFFGITMLGGIVFPKTLIITLPLLIIYVFTSSSKKQLKKEEEYNNLYKEKFILPLFKEMFKDIQYIPKEGMSLDKYLEAEYKDNFLNIKEISKYSSNDHIIFPIKINEKNIGNLDIYDVKLETEKDSDSHRLTIFEGLTGEFELSKNIQTKIKLNPNVISNFIDFSKNKDTISTDVSEFDKYFSIIAENKILAMRIFTSDNIEKIMDIFKNQKYIFNINIINNKLYVRISCFSAFESTIVLNKEKHVVLEREFIALEVMKKLVCLIYKIIDNIEM